MHKKDYDLNLSKSDSLFIIYNLSSSLRRIRQSNVQIFLLPTVFLPSLSNDIRFFVTLSVITKPLSFNNFLLLNTTCLSLQETNFGIIDLVFASEFVDLFFGPILCDRLIIVGVIPIWSRSLQRFMTSSSQSSPVASLIPNYSMSNLVGFICGMPYISYIRACLKLVICHLTPLLVWYFPYSKVKASRHLKKIIIEV